MTTKGLIEICVRTRSRLKKEGIEKDDRLLSAGLRLDCPRGWSSPIRLY